jgi:hypothetical protein
VGPVCSLFLFGFQNLTNTKERIPAEEGETRTTYLNFLLSQKNQSIYIYISLPKLVTNPEGKKQISGTIGENVVEKRRNRSPLAAYLVQFLCQLRLQSAACIHLSMKGQRGTAVLAAATAAL